MSRVRRRGPLTNAEFRQKCHFPPDVWWMVLPWLCVNALLVCARFNAFLYFMVVENFSWRFPGYLQTPKEWREQHSKKEDEPYDDVRILLVRAHTVAAVSMSRFFGVCEPPGIVKYPLIVIRLSTVFPRYPDRSIDGWKYTSSDEPVPVHSMYTQCVGVDVLHFLEGSRGIPVTHASSTFVRIVHSFLYAPRIKLELLDPPELWWPVMHTDMGRIEYVDSDDSADLEEMEDRELIVMGGGSTPLGGAYNIGPSGVFVLLNLSNNADDPQFATTRSFFVSSATFDRHVSMNPAVIDHVRNRPEKGWWTWVWRHPSEPRAYLHGSDCVVPNDSMFDYKRFELCRGWIDRYQEYRVRWVWKVPSWKMPPKKEKFRPEALKRFREDSFFMFMFSL